MSLEQSEVREALAEAISEPPEREKLVVTLYYYEELTLREIGEVLGVTESRVSQLHTKAILRLKAHLSGARASPPRRRRGRALASLDTSSRRDGRSRSRLGCRVRRTRAGRSAAWVLDLLLRSDCTAHRMPLTQRDLRP